MDGVIGALKNPANRRRECILLMLQDESVSIAIILQNIRSTQVHDLNKSRSTYGEYAILFPEIKNYPDKFMKYTRMQITTFHYIL